MYTSIFVMSTSASSMVFVQRGIAIQGDHALNSELWLDKIVIQKQ